MAIVPGVLQARESEVGAIRCGDQVPGRDDGMVPHKLDKFRFTSPSLTEIRKAADLYGGEITPWYPQAGHQWGRQWQIYSEVDEIDVALPPGDLIIRQDMEMWTGGGLARRCDGQTMTRPRLGPCQCPKAADCPIPGAPPGFAADWAIQDRKRRAALKHPDGCKPLTRFAVCLCDIGDFGVWMLRTRSEQAAAEVMAKAYLMEQARASGVLLSARVALVQRSQMVGGVLRQFGVPVIRLNDTVRALAEGTAGRRTLAEQLPPPPGREQVALTAARRPAAILPAGPPDMEVTAQKLADQARAATTRDQIRPLIAAARRLEIGGDLVWAPENDTGPDAADDEMPLGGYLTRRLAFLPPAGAEAEPAAASAPARRPPAQTRPAGSRGTGRPAVTDESWPGAPSP